MVEVIINQRNAMNKRTKKNLALVAAVASLGASLGVAQAGDDWETHAIKGSTNDIVGPSDSHTIKWNDPKGSSTQGKLSNQHKIIIEGDNTSNQSKVSNTIKWENNK